MRRVMAAAAVLLTLWWGVVLLSRNAYSPPRWPETGHPITGGRSRAVPAESPSDRVRRPAVATRPPRGPIYVVQHARGRVFALTIDDGPSAQYTPAMLAILRRHHVHATFCLIGEWVVAHPALVRAEAAAGERLCDHTYTHDEQLEHRPPARVEAEIDRTLRALHAAAPHAVVDYYRSPGGNFGPRQDTVAARDGLLPLAWNVDSEDWRGLTAAQILTRLRAGLHPGAILLVHDGGGNRTATLHAVDAFLTWAATLGYHATFPTTGAT